MAKGKNFKVTKESKVTYKVKGATFDRGYLIDEEGEIIDLVADLKTVFENGCFDLTVVTSRKDLLDVVDLASQDEDELEEE